MSKHLTPKALAEEIGVDPKSVRGFLRREFPRTDEARNTSWIVPAPAAKAARDHFAKQRAAKAPAKPMIVMGAGAVPKA